jgi:hypothetical protein
MTYSYIYIGDWLCDMTHLCVKHDSFICDMAPLYVPWFIWHDSFICDMAPLYVPWLIWHDSFICNMALLYVPWLIWHDSFTWDMIDSYIYIGDWMCDMTPSYSEFYSFILLWLLCMCHDSYDMTHSRGTWLIHTHTRECANKSIHVCVNYSRHIQRSHGTYE